jgi:hypothetical protein
MVLLPGVGDGSTKELIKNHIGRNDDGAGAWAVDYVALLVHIQTKKNALVLVKKESILN